MYRISPETEAQETLRDMGVEIGDDPRTCVEILQGLQALAMGITIEVVAEESDAWKVE